MHGQRRATGRIKMDGVRLIEDNTGAERPRVSLVEGRDGGSQYGERGKMYVDAPFPGGVTGASAQHSFAYSMGAI